jgi:hypothetical protein
MVTEGIADARRVVAEGWDCLSDQTVVHLADAMEAAQARIADVCDLKIQGEPSQKPHDRKAWTLMLPGFSEVRWVDLSAFAPTEPTP